MDPHRAQPADVDAQGLSFSWGASYAYETDLRARVLATRIDWFIRIRWVTIALCALAAVGAGLGLLPGLLRVRRGYLYFVGVALFLGAANLAFRWAAARSSRKRRLMLAQVLIDFVALAALTYATGGTATPMPAVFMAHVIVVSLFFRPPTSLLLTCLGFGCAWLAVLASAGASFWYGVILGGGFLFWWYLTSTITQSLKLREEQLAESNAMLERLDHEKTQATLRATHELKAPFSAIKGYVYVLRDGYCGELPAQALEVVGRIGDRCDRLTEMISAILKVGNLRTRAVGEAEFQPLDLVELVTREVDEAAALARARKVTVTLEPGPEEAIVVRAVPRHLHTMVSNLLRNAVAYSHEGGTVEVAVSVAKGTPVLRVTDHGIGIPRDAIPRIFDDFFRSDGAARVNPSGNGLGLALVKEVAKLHGAVIQVASEAGRGTTFLVLFPATAPTAQAGAAGQGSGRRDDAAEGGRA